MFPVHPNRLEDSCWLVERYWGKTGGELTAEPRNGAQSLGPVEHWVERVCKRKTVYVSYINVKLNCREGKRGWGCMLQSEDKGLGYIIGNIRLLWVKRCCCGMLHGSGHIVQYGAWVFVTTYLAFWDFLKIAIYLKWLPEGLLLELCNETIKVTILPIN